MPFTQQIKCNFITMPISDRDFRELEEAFEEYIKKTDKLELVTYGIDGQNGLRSKVKELFDYKEEIEGKLERVWDFLEKWNEYQKNVKRLFWVLLTSVLVTLVMNYIKTESTIKTNERSQEILNNIETTIKDNVQLPGQE